MNRSFWPIANQGRGFEAHANPPYSAVVPLVAEWSPAVFGGTTGATATNADAASVSTRVTSGSMIFPQTPNIATIVAGTENNRHALVLALPSRLGCFVVTPIRSYDSTLSQATLSGPARGTGAIEIVTDRSNFTQVASGEKSVVIGTESTGSGARSTAIGNNANSSNTNTIAIGANSTASASSAMALGDGASASGQNSVSLGRNSLASGTTAVSVGNAASGAAQAAISIGWLAATNQANAIAIGRDAQGTGLSAAALGYQAAASGSGSVALGTAAVASAEGSAAILGTTNSRVHSIAAGVYASSTYRQTFTFQPWIFSAVGDAGYHIAQQLRTTTDATTVELLFANAAANPTPDRLAIAANTAYTWQVQVTARQTAGTGAGDVAGWTFQGVTRRGAAGAPVIIGQATTQSAADAGAAAWTAVVTVDASNMLINVTGEVGKTIRWLAYWTITRIGG